MRRRLNFALAVAATVTAGALPTLALAQYISFADAPLGAVPREFEPRQTGPGASGQWEVVEDNGAAGGKAVAQVSADRTDGRFPLLVRVPTVSVDVQVSTRFKAVSGKVDQAGGLAVRLVDPNNYYVVRANALEGNVRFYKVVGGKRQQLAGANLPVAQNEWHELTLRAEGDRFTISFDGKELFSTMDRTLRSPGKVALWTKADSITRFDRLEIKSLD